MGGGAGELTGPDFSQGVFATDVTEGKTLLGHAGGEAVLLARVDGDVFAVGATCTHYSGPLADGIVVGDTVRCPWHHACFSLRSGEAVRAPALNPIPCFQVETRDDKLFVLGKKPAAQKTTMANAPESVVIVGGGAAGHAAAEMLRREGYRWPITLLSADASPPVDRPNLSKDYLAGTAPEEWIPLRPAEFFQEHDIDLVQNARVIALDTVEKTVRLEGGKTYPYGALLLATGADPVRLTIPGADLPHVHSLRTLSDSRAIIAALGKAKRAVVVGASFIGLEVAAALRTRDLEVHVVAPDRLPLEKVLGPDVGAFIKALHEEHGVSFHLGKRPASITASLVTLDDGSTLEADLVITGVGVRPNIALAEAAGIKVDRGVTVDVHLATSAPDVYAAGDIARWPDPHSGDAIRVEHWVVAQRHGQIAARNMLGKRERCEIAPFFWSQHYDVGVLYVGHAENWDRAVVDGDIAAKDATIRYQRGDKTLAVATIGRDLDNLKAELEIERS